MEKFTEKQVEDFEKLIECAEKYIEENALTVLNKIIEKEYDNCSDFINAKYKPSHTIEELKSKTSEDLKEIIVKKLCFHIQNYQAMPKIIDYNSNEKIILKCVYECTNFDEIKKKLLGNNIKIKKNNKVNSAWAKYIKGLMDIQDYIENFNKENFITALEKINNDPLSSRQDGRKKTKYVDCIKCITGIGNAVKYDFFKELCCNGLAKPDVHIKDLCAHIIEDKNDDKIVSKFVKLCKKTKKNPYYVDKILWLCCTGDFYKHGIIISRMTRRNFLKYCNPNGTVS